MKREDNAITQRLFITLTRLGARLVIVDRDGISLIALLHIPLLGLDSLAGDSFGYAFDGLRHPTCHVGAIDDAVLGMTWLRMREEREEKHLVVMAKLVAG